MCGDRPALLLLVLDQHVFAVEKEDVELLDPAMGDVRRAVINKLIPRADHRPLVQFRPHQPTRRLTHRFERANPSETEPGAGERLGSSAKRPNRSSRPLANGFTSPRGLTLSPAGRGSGRNK